MEITFENINQAIAALKQCSKENKYKKTDTGNVVISDLCEDVAKFLETELFNKNKNDQSWYNKGYNEGYADGYNDAHYTIDDDTVKNPVCENIMKVGISHKEKLNLLIDAIDHEYLQIGGDYDKSLSYVVSDKLKYIKKLNLEEETDSLNHDAT